MLTLMSRENTVYPLNKEKIFPAVEVEFNSFYSFLLLTCYKFDEGE